MKSPRIFDAGVVGLGIVAAMHNDGDSVAKPPRSDPIPIVSATSNPKKKKPRDVVVDEDEDVELSESYTRVTSRLGNTTMTTASAKKRVYSDHGNVLVASSSIVCWDDPPPAPPGLFFQSSSPVPPLLFWAEDFLNRCNLCRKSLDGCDIFMYRGEKAFCSVECRCQQILSEEHRAKCGSEVMKSFDYSVSPCLAPLHFAAGVAAA